MSFGAKFISPNTGVVLNNEMDDFSTPNTSNAFNLPPSVANFIGSLAVGYPCVFLSYVLFLHDLLAPGKRPLSSMSPTIVTQDGNVYLVVGASGGSRIITATLQVMNDPSHGPLIHCLGFMCLATRHQALLGVVAYKQDVWKAVSSPRLHNQLLPPYVYTEEAFPKSVTDYLKQLGHDVHLTSSAIV